MRRDYFMQRSHSILALGAFALVAGCGGNSSSTGSGIPVPTTVNAAATGYTISVFATLSGTLQPDDLVIHNGSLYVVAQDPNNNPDGTDVAGTTPQSQVIEYDLTGKVIMTFNVPGHPDGIMEYDANTLWVSTNEDANPMLIVINTTSNTQVTLTADATPVHGGGLDDMKLLNGVVYIAASNPALGSATAADPYGTTTVPSMYTLTLNSDNETYHLTPALMGNATATDLISNMPVTLNMTDPDSMAVDTAGDLVIDSQQDSELVFIHAPGAGQTVSVLPLTLYGNPWPVDDTKWAIANSYMLVADNASQLIYRIDSSAGFTTGSAYSNGVGSVLQLDTATGSFTPIYVGLGNPHGMVFVAQ
jgi:hypothetical protein